MVWFPSRGWLFLSHSDAGFITSVTVSYWCYIWNVPSRNTPASVICATRAPDRSCVARSLSLGSRSPSAASLILARPFAPPALPLVAARPRRCDDVRVCKPTYMYVGVGCSAPWGASLPGVTSESVGVDRGDRRRAGCVVRLRAVWGVARLRRPQPRGREAASRARRAGARRLAMACLLSDRCGLGQRLPTSYYQLLLPLLLPLLPQPAVDEGPAADGAVPLILKHS